jgi:hypothetical protein
MPLSTIYHNGVRVMVFNVTFNNISQWYLIPLSIIDHNGVRVFNATFNNISQWGYGV